MFSKHSNDKIVILIVYVDEMTRRKYPIETVLVKEFESRTWKTEYFLGIVVARSNNCIFIPRENALAS